jgi:RNA polymerase sigma factor (sigma-70 family)
MSMTADWDETEFEAIFREHYQRVVRVTRRVLRRDSEAEEIGAEVFLRLYRGGPGVAAGGLVGGWLYRTASRAAIDALRAQQRRGLEEDVEAGAHSEDPAEGPLTQLLRAERIAQVRSVLAQLKVDKAQILLLRYGGLKYQEIAAAMHISAASVGTMLARAEAEFSRLYDQQQDLKRKASLFETVKERR